MFRARRSASAGYQRVIRATTKLRPQIDVGRVLIGASSGRKVLPRPRRSLTCWKLHEVFSRPHPTRARRLTLSCASTAVSPPPLRVRGRERERRKL
jgi:hypothetical protein